MSRRTMLTLALVATTGCDTLRGKISNGEPDCWPDVQSEEYAVDAMLPLGFTAQQAIDALLLGERGIFVRWEDRSTEPATLVAQANPTTVTYSFYPDLPEQCSTKWYPDTKWVSIPGTLAIVTTESTRLNESMEISFDVTDVEEATFLSKLPSTDFQGSYEPPACEECESVSIRVSGEFTPNSNSGEFYIYGTMPLWFPRLDTASLDTAVPPEPETIYLATIEWY